MPKKRHAMLTLSGPGDQTVTDRADFEKLTLTRTQVGGYQSHPTDPTSFTAAAADAFWKRLQQLAALGLRHEQPWMVDGESWRFEARDGKTAYAASGQMSDGLSTGGDDETGYKYGNQPDPVPPTSYADLRALFDLLKP